MAIYRIKLFALNEGEHKEENDRKYWTQKESRSNKGKSIQYIIDRKNEIQQKEETDSTSGSKLCDSKKRTGVQRYNLIRK